MSRWSRIPAAAFVVLAVCALPTSLSAQRDREPPPTPQSQARPPVSPEPDPAVWPGDRGLSTFAPRTTEGDLFRARPGTYAPRFDRLDRRGGSLSGPFIGGGYPFVAVPYVVEQPVRPPLRDRRWDHLAREPRRARPAPAAPATVTVAPPPQRTFFVIPGCYAGDVRPSTEQLPRGCDLSRLRIVPPRGTANR